MCLSIKVNRPECVLEEGTHEGFEYVIVHNGMGYRCGYVKVEPNHPWHGKGYDDVEVSVHGGLTFAESDLPCSKGGPDNGYWFGFDCAHAGDGQDPLLPTERKFESDFFKSGTVRTQDYVRQECKNLCEQAKAALG